MQNFVKKNFNTQSKSLNLVVGLFSVLFGSLALWASAKISVPMWPVPLTMQTLVVLLIGAFYGPKLALITVLTYLVQGGLGLPVFSGTPQNGIGLAYLLGPTGGYLFGFVPAVWIVGTMSSKEYVGFFRTFLACLISISTIFLIGTFYLSFFVGIKTAIYAGLIPFLLGDFLKILVAAGLISLIKQKQ